MVSRIEKKIVNGRVVIDRSKGITQKKRFDSSRDELQMGKTRISDGKVINWSNGSKWVP